MQRAVCDILSRFVTLQQAFSMQHKFRWRKAIFSLTCFVIKSSVWRNLRQQLQAEKLCKIFISFSLFFRCKFRETKIRFGNRFFRSILLFFQFCAEINYESKRKKKKFSLDVKCTRAHCAAFAVRLTRCGWLIAIPFDAVTHVGYFLRPSFQHDRLFRDFFECFTVMMMQPSSIGSSRHS